MSGYYTSLYLLFFIPFFLIMSLAFYFDYVPKKKEILSVLYFTIETDLAVLLKRNNFKNTNTFSFQIIRIIICTMISMSILLIKSAKLKGIMFILAFVISYKGIYLFLLLLDNNRIKKLNKELPYMIKSILLLAYNYPINTAILKSIDNVSDLFKDDLEKLLLDIDNDPISFKPYQNFIDRYEGRLNNLNIYLKTIYRISTSSKNEEKKILGNLTESIINDVENSRKQKNDSINLTVSFIGLIPVLLLCFVLCFLMIQTISII